MPPMAKQSSSASSSSIRVERHGVDRATRPPSRSSSFDHRHVTAAAIRGLYAAPSALWATPSSQRTGRRPNWVSAPPCPSSRKRDPHRLRIFFGAWHQTARRASSCFLPRARLRRVPACSVLCDAWRQVSSSAGNGFRVAPAGLFRRLTFRSDGSDPCLTHLGPQPQPCPRIHPEWRGGPLGVKKPRSSMAAVQLYPYVFGQRAQAPRPEKQAPIVDPRPVLRPIQSRDPAQDSGSLPPGSSGLQ